MSVEPNVTSTLTQEEVEAIVKQHIPAPVNEVLWKVTEIKNKGYSFSANARTYLADLSSSSASAATHTIFIVVSRPAADSARTWAPNTLGMVHGVLTAVNTHTDIPILSPILDTTRTILPYDILICPPTPITSINISSLADARKAGLLTEQDNALIDLQIGVFFGQLHSKVQNDWYGPPDVVAPADPAYTWQEAFCALLEALLDQAHAAGVQLPYVEIRHQLSRAISFHLFDDVEVPSLVWHTGSEDDIYVSTAKGRDARSGIVAILPNAAHAVWGDPLLESFFLAPGPSSTVLEGYTHGGGGPLVVFPRQKTKQIWYALFLGLVCLTERRGIVFEDEDTEINEQWALDTISRSLAALPSAPYY